MLTSRQAEMQSLRNRLQALSAKRASLLQEASSLESQLAAQTSTYKSSLETLSRQTTAYLRTTPTPHLPPSAALETWKLESAALGEDLEKAKIEQEACTEGVSMWRDVLGLVKAFERSLAERTKAAQSPRSQLREVGGRSRKRNDLSPSEYARERSAELGLRSGGHSRSTSLSGSGTSTPEERRLLAEVEDIARQLESRKELAEVRGWRLLVACISAELMAFQQAQEILAGQIPGFTGMQHSRSLSMGHPMGRSSSLGQGMGQSPRLLDHDDEEEETVDFSAKVPSELLGLETEKVPAELMGLETERVPSELTGFEAERVPNELMGLDAAEDRMPMLSPGIEELDRAFGIKLGIGMEERAVFGGS